MHKKIKIYQLFNGIALGKIKKGFRFKYRQYTFVFKRNRIRTEDKILVYLDGHEDYSYLQDEVIDCYGKVNYYKFLNETIEILEDGEAE